MKYATAATAATALLPLASAAHVGARESTGLTYQISDLDAGCSPSYGTTYCYYSMTVHKSDNPDFGVGCEAGGESPDGALPASDKAWDCGPYTLTVSKAGDGGLEFLLNEPRKHMAGTFTVRKDELKPKATQNGDGKEGQVWSYREGKPFDVKVESGKEALPPISAAPSGSAAGEHLPTASSASAVSTASSGSASASTTAASSETSASSPSAGPSDKANGATRESAFAGVLFLVGLMALVY
ncbi:hypothetical protein PG993_003793 [Apiospora rasikravindrae]|uniref:Cell wall protein n=1 Tax=Apiospora rasikravindrae TaxID=990691 RepID=A0ABR1U0J1_9PEZI